MVFVWVCSADVPIHFILSQARCLVLLLMDLYLQGSFASRNFKKYLFDIRCFVFCFQVRRSV